MKARALFNFLLYQELLRTQYFQVKPIHIHTKVTSMKTLDESILHENFQGILLHRN